jgi:hypothetical protein
VPDKKLTACLIVALLLRLAFVFAGFPLLQQRWHLREDGDGYGIIAQSIREGRYDDVTRGPVYPVFVAVAGSSAIVKVLQALLDAATCALIYLLANRKLWAAWLWAVYPFAIWRVAFINKEIILTFLLVSYVCVQVIAFRQDKLWQWLVAGALLGIVNLCKPTFLLWPLILFLFVPRRAVLSLVAMVLMIAPWTYRNWRVTGGEFLPVATEAGGLSTFVGNYQPTLGLWEGPGKFLWMLAVSEVKAENANASAVELDRALYATAMEQAMKNPLKAVELFIRKCGRFWFLSAARREQVASFAIQGAYLVLLGIGLWRLRPWSVEVKLLLTLVAYVMLMHALSYADLRFSLPVMPFVCALGAAAARRTRVSGIATPRIVP